MKPAFYFVLHLLFNFLDCLCQLRAYRPRGFDVPSPCRLSTVYIQCEGPSQRVSVALLDRLRVETLCDAGSNEPLHVPSVYRAHLRAAPPTSAWIIASPCFIPCSMEIYSRTRI